MAGDKDIELRLRITADGKAAVSGLRELDAGIARAGDTGSAANAKLQNLTNTLFSMELLKGLFSEVFGGVEQVVAMAEAVQTLEARLGLAVAGFGNAEQAMADVQRIAEETGASLQSVGDLYTKTAGAAQALGISQEQVATVTETVAKALRVAGASGSQAESAILQFSQALTGGTFRAEEFNSVVEAAPYFVDRLADGLGVARDQLKTMVDQGLISSRELVAAVQAQSTVIDQAYGRMPQTVEQAMTRVRNALAIYLGGVNEATGASEALSKAIGLAAENIDLLGPAAAGVAAGGLAKLIQAGGEQVRVLREELTARATKAEALRQEQAQAVAAAGQAKALAAQELASSQAAVTQAQVRHAAAAQQLADMRELTIFGAQRAAAERELAAANAQLIASEQALSAAQAKVAVTTEAAAVAMTGTAAKVGILSRALSFLAGPGGILLATAAGFAAFAVSQRDAEASADDLTAAIEAQRQAIEKLGQAGLEKLIQDEERLQASTELRIQQLRKLVVDSQQWLATQRELAAAGDASARGQERLSIVEAKLLENRVALEEQQRQLAASEATVADARQRMAALTGAVTAAEAAQVVTLDELIAKRDALALALERFTAAQANAVSGGIALGQAQADLAAAEAQLAAAKASGIADLTAYSTLVADAEAKVRLLTLATQGGQAADAEAARLKRELAAANKAVAEAAKEAAAEQEAAQRDAQREITLIQARAGLLEEERQRRLDLAKARGDEVAAADIQQRIDREAVKTTKALAEAKREESAALRAQARLLEIAATASGELTAKTRDQIEATRDAAELAGLEADRLDVVARRKRDAAQAAEELANRQRILAEAFDRAGRTGVGAVDDVLRAIQSANDSGAIEALGRALEEAFRRGALGAEEYRQALEEIRKQQQQLKQQAQGSNIGAVDIERLYQQTGGDLGRARAQLGPYLDRNPALAKQILDELSAYAASQRAAREPAPQAQQPSRVVRFELDNGRRVDARVAAGDDDALIAAMERQFAVSTR